MKVQFITNSRNNITSDAPPPLQRTPPVSPKIFSSSGGGSTSYPTTLLLNPGAYWSTVPNTCHQYCYYSHYITCYYYHLNSILLCYVSLML